VGELGTVVPAAGVAATLALVIGYLLKANASDRRDYQDAVDKAEKRADDMADRATVAQLALDEERDARHHKEDLLSEAQLALRLSESMVAANARALAQMHTDQRRRADDA
jgi:hypothetical protein